MGILIRIFIMCILGFSLPVEAQNPLYIPPVLNGPIYNLNMQHGTYQFNAGITSQTMGFNGNILGPTLIMQAGQQVTLNVTNSIGEPTTVHWHGFHVSPENDGGPHTVIAPNSTWSPSFTVLNKAATYWYHPHLHDSTTKHVTRGLAGLIIVKDAEEAALNLPRTYGVDDFPLIIQTKAIAASGSIMYTGQSTNKDSNLMVNAVKNPILNVPKQFVRFRILNASPQRVFNIGLSNNGTFYQLASDGGLLANRASITRLKLAPGERAEIAVDFSSYPLNTNLELVSYANELPTGTWGATNAWIGALQAPSYYPNFMNGTTFTILKLHVIPTTINPVLSIPSALANLIPIPASQATNTRPKYLFSQGAGVKIGNTNDNSAAAAFALNVVNDRIVLNTTEIWELHGAHNQFHPFHIHDIEFFILERRDSLNQIIPLTPNETGLKDVVIVGPKETVKFITKFDDFASEVPYMYHCHITVHEDKGMMQQFIITEKIYVDKNYTGAEDGSFSQPYNTLREAVNASKDGTTVYFKSNNIHEELISDLLITKKINVQLLNGEVIIK